MFIINYGMIGIMNQLKIELNFFWVTLFMERKLRK